MTPDQLEALEDTYLTLRALLHCEMGGHVDFYCAQSISLLLHAFPELAETERLLDEMEKMT
jgi:hypothetical protein